jgi:hypothetical protein
MEKRIHLILYASESRNACDVNTFLDASQTLMNDYLRYYPNDLTIRKGFSSGEQVVNIINSQPKGSIYSLDVVSHGNQGGIQVSRDLRPPEKAPPKEAEWHYFLRGKDKLNLDPEKPQTEAQAEYREETMHGLYTNMKVALWVSRFFNQKYVKKEGLLKNEYMEGIAVRRAIDFSRFGHGCFVEFHGCRIAEKIPYLNDLFDNFAKDFADLMPRRSVVVGHTINNNPDGHPSGCKCDYRHHPVRAYEANWYSSTPLFNDEPRERWGLKFENSSTPPEGPGAPYNGGA